MKKRNDLDHDAAAVGVHPDNDVWEDWGYAKLHNLQMLPSVALSPLALIWRYG